MEKNNKDAGGAAIKSPKKGGKQNVIINPPEKVDPTRGFNEAFKKAYDRFVVTVEQKTAIVLQAKANKAQMPEEVIQQVFVRGYKDLPLNTSLTREQYAMNRVNSFIAFGEAFIHDCDLLERVGVKGTGGAMRPHIKREVSPYNGKTIYHVVDKQGRVKHSTTDEYGAKQHLAQKYDTYNEEVEQIDELSKSTIGSYVKKAAGDVGASRKLETDFERNAKSAKKQNMKDANKRLADKFKATAMKRHAGIAKAVERLTKEEVDQPVEEAKQMKGEDPCWDGYKMVGTKKKNGKEVPNCVPEQAVVEGFMSFKQLNELSPATLSRYITKRQSSPTRTKAAVDTISKRFSGHKGPTKLDHINHGLRRARQKIDDAREKQTSMNPRKPRSTSAPKTGFRSGAIDDTFGT